MIGKHPFQSLKLSIAAVCEYALESRGRWTLVGTFRELEFDRFPATVQRMEVFLLFTDVTDPDIRTAGVSLWRAVGTEDFEAEEPVFTELAPVSKPSFPFALQTVIRLRDVEFEQPGSYNLYIDVEGEVFDVVSLYVRRSQ